MSWSRRPRSAWASASATAAGKAAHRNGLLLPRPGVVSRGVFFWFREDDDVLSWKHLGGFYPLQVLPCHLRAHLLFRHLVHELDRDIGIFLSILHENQPASRLQSAHHGLGHFVGILEFVVD